MTENIKSQLEGLSVDSALQSVVYWYLWINLLIGGLLLGLLIYRSVKTVRSSFQSRIEDTEKYKMSLKMTLYLFQIYLVISIMLSYFAIIISEMRPVNFLFPLNLLVEWNLANSDSLWFYMVVTMVGSFMVLVSCTIVLHGIVRLLKSPKGSYQGIGIMIAGMVSSVLPVVFYII